MKIMLRFARAAKMLLLRSNGLRSPSSARPHISMAKMIIMIKQKMIIMIKLTSFMITEIKATIQILINVIVIFGGIYLLGRFWWFCILLVFDDISVDAGGTSPSI